jgi:D-alanyl-D-alanine carboxypeptidase (penicillin-binding protein 5/6)
VRPSAPRRRLGAALVIGALIALPAAGCGPRARAETGPSAAHRASSPAASSGAASPLPPASARPAPATEAWSGILIDRRTGEVLWAKDRDRELPPASCTKIMTALLVLERVDDLDAYATVPQIPLPQKVGVGLAPGDRITVRQALYALMVKSANDAALTLASHVAGSEEAFVAMMNRRALQLGLTHTHFVNSRGIPTPGHYSSAGDLATLGRFAMRDPIFREVVATRHAVIRYPPGAAVPVESHNRLLDYPWGDGIKTGATAASGMVLVGSGRLRGIPLIVVTMHEPTRDQEERDALALLGWGAALLAEREPTVPSASP